jgi:hypothetical protein
MYVYMYVFVCIHVDAVCQDLFERRRVAVVGVVDDNLLVGPVRARLEFTKELDRRANVTGDEVLNLTRVHDANLKMIDADWEFERLMVEALCGEKSEEKLVKRMLSFMPSQAVAVEIESALSDISRMSSQYVFKLSSKTAQAKHGLVVQLLGRLLDARSPDFKGYGDDASLAKIVERLQFFVRFEKTVNKKLVISTGALALNEILGVAKFKDAGSDISKELTTLKTFVYLATPTVKTEIYAFLEANKSRDMAGSLSTGASSSTDKSGSGAKKDKAVQDAMGMFV